MLFRSQAVVSCCGITLPAQDIAEAEDADEHHQLTVERVEDELFVTIHHPMTKDHFISFIAYLTVSWWCSSASSASAMSCAGRMMPQQLTTACPVAWSTLPQTGQT